MEVNLEAPLAQLQAFQERDEATEARLQTLLLDADEAIQQTTEESRNDLSKDGLLQRNLEIQAEMLWLDRKYIEILNSDHTEDQVKAIDEQMDTLAEESDAIEALLEEKHGVENGGRFLLNDNVLESSQLGLVIANGVFHQGPSSNSNTTSAPDANEASTADAADHSHSVVEATLAQDNSLSAEVEAALAETRERRKRRREEGKTTLLGKLMAHYDAEEKKQVVQTPKRVKTSTRKGTSTPRVFEASQYSHHAGLVRCRVPACAECLLHHNLPVDAPIHVQSVTTTAKGINLTLRSDALATYTMRLLCDVKDVHHMISALWCLIRSNLAITKSTTVCLGETPSTAVLAMDIYLLDDVVKTSQVYLRTNAQKMALHSLLRFCCAGASRPFGFESLVSLQCVHGKPDHAQSTASRRKRVAPEHDTASPAPKINFPKVRRKRAAPAPAKQETQPAQTARPQMKEEPNPSPQAVTEAKTEPVKQSTPSVPPSADSGVNCSFQVAVSVATRKARAELDLVDLYEQLRPTPNWSQEYAQPPDITTTMRPYQRKALSWMLMRERDPPPFQQPHIERFCLADGTALFYKAVSGELEVDEAKQEEKVSPSSLKKEFESMFPSCRGGICAEEMGLGKTLEMIALMTEHRFQAPNVDATTAFIDDEVVPIPIMTNDDGAEVFLEAKTTLIVSPQSIVYQWKAEVEKHNNKLKVFVYMGRTSGSRSRKARVIKYSELAQYDIVLTSYSVLGSEVHYSRTLQHNLRRSKKYRIPDTPLLQLKWWRVILDEAQYIERPVSKSAQMANRLTTVHKWCVSGTPIGKAGLNDLYGLMVFLRFYPYDSMSYWQNFTEKPYYYGLPGSLVPILRSLMWRHSKHHVEDEIALPPLTYENVMLNFAPVEEEYYRKCLGETQGRVFTAVASGNMRLTQTVKALDALRQACCHPHVRYTDMLGHKLLQMSEIGERMLRSAKDELTSEERELCRHLNQLGDLYIVQEKQQQALAVFQQAWNIEDAGIDYKDKSKEAAFEQTEDQKEANAQIMQWRWIDLVTTTRLIELQKRQVASLLAEGATEDHASVKTAREAIGRLAVQYASVEEELLENVQAVYIDLRNRVNEYEDILNGMTKEEMDSRVPPLLRKRSELGAEQFEEHPLYQEMVVLSQQLAPVQASYARVLRVFYHKLELRRLTPIISCDSQLAVLKAVCHMEMRQFQPHWLMRYRHQHHSSVRVVPRRTITSQSSGEQGKPDESQSSSTPASEPKQDEGAVARAAIQSEIDLTAESSQMKNPQPLLSAQRIVALEAAKRSGKSSKKVARSLTKKEVARKFIDHIRKAVQSLRRSMRLSLADIPDADQIDFDSDEDSARYRAKWNRVHDSLTACRIVFEIKRDRQRLRIAEKDLNDMKNNITVAKRMTSFDANDDGTALIHKVKALRVSCARKQNRLTYLKQKFKSQSPEHDGTNECAICREENKCPVIAACGHSGFCAYCLRKWIFERGSCPKCRVSLSRDSVIAVDMRAEETIRTKKGIVIRSTDDAIAEASLRMQTTVNQKLTVAGEGQNGTKIDAIVKYLKVLTKDCPYHRGASCRVLVYSHFERMMALIAKGLTDNHIPLVVLKGSAKERSKQLQKFHEHDCFPKPKVLLLSMKTDNSGLSLVTATHVILAEPSINAAMEMQAVNRIHRIGQTHRALVHKFIVERSVEEKIIDLQTAKNGARKGEDLKQNQKEEMDIDELVSFLELDSRPAGHSAVVQAQTTTT